MAKFARAEIATIVSRLNFLSRNWSFLFTLIIMQMQISEVKVWENVRFRVEKLWLLVDTRAQKQKVAKVGERS